MQERVLWPRGRRTVTARPVAPRLETLAGKTIGQLGDDLFRGDEIFPMLYPAARPRPVVGLSAVPRHPGDRRAARCDIG
jgi:hypothetical protein